MSKGMLLNYMADKDIKAKVPEKNVWLFIDHSKIDNTPTIKGRLPDGTTIVFNKTVTIEENK